MTVFTLQYPLYIQMNNFWSSPHPSFTQQNVVNAISMMIFSLPYSLRTLTNTRTSRTWRTTQRTRKRQAWHQNSFLAQFCKDILYNVQLKDSTSRSWSHRFKYQHPGVQSQNYNSVCTIYCIVRRDIVA